MNFRVNINICRVCMKSDDGASLKDDQELGEKFVFTTRLKLNENDDMPSLICSKCSKRLRVSYDFVKLAHESENNLKAFLIKISKDFQLVTKSTSEKIKSSEEEDDDELLTSILEDESASEKLSSQQVPIQKHENTVHSCKLLPKRRPTAIEKQESREQTTSNEIKRNAGDFSYYTTDDVGSNLVERNFKKENTSKEMEMFDLNKPEEEIEMVTGEGEAISDFNLKSHVSLNILDNVQPTSNAEPQNDAPSDHEIQILDFTDEESQTELEILEEDLQQSDYTRSSLEEGGEQPCRSDGYFKEYQTMLEDGDEYLEDTNSLHVKKTSKELRLYDDSEELLEDAEIEMKSIEAKPKEENPNVATTPPAVESMEREKEARSKSSKTSTRTYARGLNPKAAKKGDGLFTSKRFFCFKCNRDFSTKTNLTRHMATHEGNRQFQCDVCNKSFSQNASLKQHMYTHTGEKPYQCEVCHRGFTQCKSLVFHMRRHTGEKPFPCEKCGALFRQKDGLKTHILKRHTIKSQHGSMELITCAICKEVHADKSSLQHHMKKHLNDYVRVDSAMSCASREGNMRENPDLVLECIDDDPLHEKSSVSIEESVPDIACDISSSAHIVDLMTTSAMEPSRAKQYQCRKCFKCFAIRKNLIRHLTTHSIAVDSEEFPCKLCELCFGSSELLGAHTSKEHNNTANINHCELCQSNFLSEEELRKHSNLPHTFKCHECPNMQFISRRLLSEHMMDHELNEIQ